MPSTKIILTKVSAIDGDTDLRHALIQVNDRFTATRDMAAKVFALYDANGPATVGFEGWDYVAMGNFPALSEGVQDRLDEDGAVAITDPDTVKMANLVVSGRLSGGDGLTPANMGVVSIEFTPSGFRVSGVEKYAEVEVSSRNISFSFLDSISN